MLMCSYYVISPCGWCEYVYVLYVYVLYVYVLYVYVYASIYTYMCIWVLEFVYNVHTAALNAVFFIISKSCLEE